MQLSQMVEGHYIARSGYVLIINNYPVDELFQLEHSEKRIQFRTEIRLYDQRRSQPDYR